MNMVAKLMCRWFGHREEHSPRRRSPFTVYTHWRDVTCSRCGTDLGDVREYNDALTHPELFRATELFRTEDKT